jgi:hypothetical protein
VFWFNVATRAAAIVPDVMLEPLSDVSDAPEPVTEVNAPVVPETLPNEPLPVTLNDDKVPTPVRHLKQLRHSLLCFGSM